MSDRGSIEAQIALSRKKSLALGLIATFFLGPLGLFYASILGGFIMLIVAAVVFVFTLGFGYFVIHPICMIWAALSISSHNRNCEDDARDGIGR